MERDTVGLVRVGNGTSNSMLDIIRSIGMVSANPDIEISYSSVNHF